MSEYHWKKIAVPQLTLSDMPLVHVYVKTTFESNEEGSQPTQLWKDITAGFSSTPTADSGVVLYDEGYIYVYYKQVLTALFDEHYIDTVYTTSGEYQIVVLK